MGLFDRLFRRSGPDRFAGEVLGRLRAAGIREARYHREQFAIEYRPAPGRDPTWMHLANLYAECRQDPGHRVDRIDQFVATFISLPGMPETWEEAKPLLRPVLRGASFGRGASAKRRIVLRRPAVPYLDELVVVDQPTSMSYVAEGMWGVPAERVFATARANLAAQPRLPQTGPDGAPAALRFFDAGDSYFVSHLLIDGWLASLADQVGGRPVAFAPDPASLIVVADDPDALGPLFDAVAGEYEEAPRALSPMGYTIDAFGRLVPYSVPGHHPLAATVARAERTLAAVEYETQRSVLQQDEGTGGYFVAGCLLAKRDDGTAFTVANWTTQVPTLLPLVDYVAVGSGDDPSMLVPWQALMDEDLLNEAVEFRPTRFRTAGQPRPDVLDRLAERTARP